MAVLTTQQRNTLEIAVKEARRAAEKGAFHALHSLGVDNPVVFAHLSPDERSLRNLLRSKGRLLGDELPASGEQNITNLCYELAYETWHKMLFARFLEANNLLMHPDGVAVTLADCEELAQEESFADKWEAAAFYASRMLPAIFRPDDPLMQLHYATNDRIRLEGIIDALDNSIFTADDALGWVYQFWQSEAKAAINASGDKIDGRKLPAVTQLFTEPYMVHFLIDNTLGAWWVSRHRGTPPPVKFDYLRLLDDGSPAAGTFEGWPNTTAEVTALDPCMGSGHFVASLFPVLATLRMYEEGLTKEEATDRVIAENLHGLELDARCTQIAAFNLAFTAWKFCGYYRALPEMNLACSGIAPKGKEDDWVNLVGKVNDPVEKERMENGMRALYQHFQLAPELGSLLDPTTIKADAFTASFEQLQPVLLKALQEEVDSEQVERGVMAAGIAKAGEILAGKYTLQITNVPYLSRGKQDTILSDYCDKNFSEAKGDLATVFLEKMLKSNSYGGVSCSVIPQNWLFLTSYRKFREKLLKNESWSSIARLGSKAFQTPMWDFNVMLVAISHKKPTEHQQILGLDVSEEANAMQKDEGLKKMQFIQVVQEIQLKNSDSRIVLNEELTVERLEKFAKGVVGVQTGDFPQFGRYIWELIKNNDWEYEATTQSSTKHYGGQNFLIYWQNFKGILSERQKTGESYVRGWAAFGKKGVLISPTGNINSSIYNGELFDNNCAVILPENDIYLAPIWCYCSSPEFNIEVRKIDQALKVTNATLVKVPFDLDHWQKVAAEKYPNGLPQPYSDDPTQWLFHGHPIKAEHPLQVAVTRLLGYRWPAENDAEMELADEARELIKAVKAFDALSDEDGIFCITSVNGEASGADRLRNFIMELWGDAWTSTTITNLLAEEGATAANLEEWLRKEFFVQHCKLFQNRPFIWHIWDGRADGFSALVNYHQLNNENLSKLIYTYLGDWIRMCDAGRKEGVSGADGQYSAALQLKEKLEAILQGEAPYDIFVRWKTLQEQPIGWNPDLNDGVRLNVRPFVQAGVLRSKFNVKWGIDRGKNPAGSPWGEIRDNDTHLTLEEKRNARKQN
jgi:hypothetical protein